MFFISIRTYTFCRKFLEKILKFSLEFRGAHFMFRPSRQNLLCFDHAQSKQLLERAGFKKDSNRTCSTALEPSKICFDRAENCARLCSTQELHRSTLWASGSNYARPSRGFLTVSFLSFVCLPISAVIFHQLWSTLAEFGQTWTLLVDFDKRSSVLADFARTFDNFGQARSIAVT